jgi:pimeloyl-ACP methyl ester carboxylesterase
MNPSRVSWGDVLGLKCLHYLPAVCLVFLQFGCTSVPTFEQRVHTADRLAAAHGWRSFQVPANEFQLVAYASPALASADHLTIYIEGDGLAWQRRDKVSDDPTPVEPVALGMALNQGQGPAVYLARPCQYSQSDNAACRPSTWTRGRFSVQVVEAMNQAVERLKARYRARTLTLVGYSGGGAIALLIAARRDDVAKVVTVAGTLDHRAWTDLHHFTPLHDSLNPVDAWQQLERIPQLHLVGGVDANMPLPIAQSYIRRFPAGRVPLLKVVPGFDHSCCWVRDWPSIYAADALGAGAD